MHVPELLQTRHPPHCHHPSNPIHSLETERYPIQYPARFEIIAFLVLIFLAPFSNTFFFYPFSGNKEKDPQNYN